MKKMKPTSTQPCTHCKDRATWRSSGFSLNKWEYACESHKEIIRLKEAAANQRRDDHMSEADYQTWGRL